MLGSATPLQLAPSEVIAQLGLADVLQVAGFPSPYHFAAAAADPFESGTKRSPYALLRLLREASISASAEDPRDRLREVLSVHADHANIARVLDAGTSSAGRPYFVMDLVKGVPKELALSRLNTGTVRDCMRWLRPGLFFNLVGARWHLGYNILTGRMAMFPS